MRKLQIAVFVVAIAVLLAAAACIGRPVGDELRKAGLAALLVDVVCLQLWPAGLRERSPQATPEAS